MVAIVADLREQLRYSALGPVPTYIKKLLAIVAGTDWEISDG